MYLLKYVFILFLSLSFLSPFLAAADHATISSCGIYNEADGADEEGDKKEDEEEPDCE